MTVNSHDRHPEEVLTTANVDDRHQGVQQDLMIVETAVSTEDGEKTCLNAYLDKLNARMVYLCKEVVMLDVVQRMPREKRCEDEVIRLHNEVVLEITIVVAETVIAEVVIEITTGLLVATMKEDGRFQVVVTTEDEALLLLIVKDAAREIGKVTAARAGEDIKGFAKCFLPLSKIMMRASIKGRLHHDRNKGHWLLQFTFHCYDKDSIESRHLITSRGIFLVDCSLF